MMILYLWALSGKWVTKTRLKYGGLFIGNVLSLQSVCLKAVRCYLFLWPHGLTNQTALDIESARVFLKFWVHSCAVCLDMIFQSLVLINNHSSTMQQTLSELNAAFMLLGDLK